MTDEPLDVPGLRRVLAMCEAGKGHNPGCVSVSTATFRALLDRLDTLEACLICDDASVRSAWARERKLRDILCRLWTEVARGSAGHEGSELLEVMSEARCELDRKGTVSRQGPDAPSPESA